MAGETAPLPIPDDSVMTHLHFAELHVIDIGPKRGVSARVAFGTEHGETIGFTTIMSSDAHLSSGMSLISDETVDLLRQVKASLLRDAQRTLSSSGQVGSSPLQEEEDDPDDPFGESDFQLG